MKKENDTLKNYINGIANLTVVRNFFFIGFIVVSIICIGEMFLINSLSKVVKNQKPLPIFIDRTTGVAKEVDFKIIDAEGSKRHKSEVYDFVGNFINNLYTFNQYTIKSNLNRALSFCSKEAEASINKYLIEERAKYMNDSIQGMCKIKSIEILEKLPDLKCRVVFFKSVVNIGSDTDIKKELFTAILRIKTIIRKRGNAHGFIIVEYWENKINE